MSDSLMNAIFTVTFVTLVFIVWGFLEKIIFYLTKEKIKNEKEIINFFKKRYKEKFPKSLEIEVVRPLKKNYEWKIFVKNDFFNLKTGRYKEESFQFSVLLHDEMCSIKKEKKFNIEKNIDYTENTGDMVYQKCWDEDGNEINCED